MTNSRTTKKALLSSALALTLCVAMLIATTFAWFTDTASTSVNKIQAGTLDVALEMAIEWNADGSVKTWSSAEGTTLQFKKASDVNGTEVLWEPGCTYSLPELHVVNKGNLALKYKILITGIQGDATLNEAITWTMKNGGDELDLANNEYQLLAQDAVSGNIIISGHMKEDAGNKYQGLSIDGIAITVVATQLNNEYDSEGNEYDKNALYPEYVAPVNSNATGNLTVNSTTSGAATTVTVKGDSQEISDSVMSVTYPEGVILNTTSVSEGSTVRKKQPLRSRLSMSAPRRRAQV